MTLYCNVLTLFPKSWVWLALPSLARALASAGRIRLSCALNFESEGYGVAFGEALGAADRSFQGQEVAAGSAVGEDRSLPARFPNRCNHTHRAKTPSHPRVLGFYRL